MFALSEMQSGLVETVTRVRTGTRTSTWGRRKCSGQYHLSQRTEQQAAALGADRIEHGRDDGEREADANSARKPPSWQAKPPMWPNGSGVVEQLFTP